MNVTTGLLLIAFGGLASGIFYLPLKYVKNWSWEAGWSIYSVFALLLGPWILAMITVPGLFGIIGDSPTSNIVWPIVFGFGWGIGGLTWGLSIRYLGIGLGNALPLGLTSALSTIIGPLVPILINAELRSNGIGVAISEKMSGMFAGDQGTFTLLSILISLAGIGVCGWAASRKDTEQRNNETAKNEGFDFKKGLLVALVAGVMSACFAFGEYAGTAMSALTAERNPGTIWQYNAVYAVLLIGGFTFNFAYCMYLLSKNKTFSNFTPKISTLKINLFFAALAGIIWFTQFVFKGMGTTKIPENLSFITWSLLFTFVIVFSNIVGLISNEWKGVSRKTMLVLISGLSILILSAALSGYGSYLGQ